jgi:ubiquinone/menaquinone biosynthesis C-methylase UbiE
MGALREFELAGWQGAAATYEGFAGATRLFVPALVQAAGAKPGLRLLDLACGTGVAVRAAADAGAHVTGVDFSPAMLAMARSLYPGIAFEVGDAEQLPFPDASFDAVIANFGIHHVEHPERAVAEARRVLVSGGMLAFTVWADPQENTAWRIIFDAVQACGRLNVPMPAGNDAIATRENFARLLIEAGFHPATLQSRLLTENWLLPPAADLVSIFETGTVRMATLLRGQGEALRAVRRHVADALRSHRRDGMIVLPTRAWLISARTGEA